MKSIKNFIIAALLLSPVAHASEAKIHDLSIRTLEEAQSVAQQIISPYANRLSSGFKVEFAEIAWSEEWIQQFSAIMGQVITQDEIRVQITLDPRQKPQVTRSTLVGVLCHELGHILGGEPIYLVDGFFKKGFSYEGQADYFAAKECMPQYFRRADVLGIPATNTGIDETNHQAEDRHAICKGEVTCENVLYSGMKLFQGFTNRILPAAFDSFEKPMQEVSYLRKSAIEVKVTNPAHPNLHCRADTIKAGFFGLKRPACWFY